MNRQSMLEQITQYDFYCLDLKLYLNTHPCETQALELFAHMAEKSAELTKEFEKNHCLLRANGAHGSDYFKWINEPWPWEQQFNTL